MNRTLRKLVISLLGIAILVFIGERAARSTALGWLKRTSFDLPFLGRGHIERPEVAMVYMDDHSARALGQGDPWDRRVHTKLLERLTQEGARLVFFDLVFEGTSSDPAVDASFAEAMKAHGNVIIGGALDISPTSGQYQEIINAPHPTFRRAAAGWGLLVFRPVDPDYGVRQFYGGNDQKGSAAWVAATKLGAPLTSNPEERFKERWLNYYGPARWLPGVSYAQALKEGDLRPGFFKDKYVFIGGRTTMGRLGIGKDDFRTPYTGFLGKSGRGDEREIHGHAAGVEVHATAVMNLLRSEWLTRLPEKTESRLLIGCGILFGTLFAIMRPRSATVTALVGMVLITLGAFWLVHQKHIWFSWLVPVGLQIPAGWIWFFSANYYFETRKRNAIKKALGQYLSPHMANQVAEAEVDLRPGGKLVEATVMFTDLEGFTSLSESLGDPQKLTEVLTEYFTRTTVHVLEKDGMIVKFIGDAVLALWGAPLPDQNQATKAATAAIALYNASKKEINGLSLRTRIGIHSGKVVAGNLGSAQRFDYTVIGDPVNFASRLEGLNKYLGTAILMSDSTFQKIGSGFITRRIGTIRVSGKATSMVIHELLPDGTEDDREWITDFENAVSAFTKGDLSSAEVLFERVIHQRESDGPSSRYLGEIRNCDGVAGENWSGVLAFATK